MRNLYENLHIFYFQKRIVSAEIQYVLCKVRQNLTGLSIMYYTHLPTSTKHFKDKIYVVYTDRYAMFRNEQGSPISAA